MTTTWDDEGAVAARMALMHGGTVEAVVALPGVVNRVFRVTGPGNDWVVRYPVDARRPDEFPVEIWAAHHARLRGIPTPDVVATGQLDHRPYVIVEYVEPSRNQDVDELWRWLGTYATVVSTVPLHKAPQEIFSRFGRDLPLAWQAHLGYNLDALSPADPLLADGVYQRQDLGHLRTLIERLASVDFAFGLAHGDLAPRNLISRPAPLPPVLLDWGTATSGPAPWTDLQRVYTWAVHEQTISSTALDEFAQGVGVTLGDQERAILEQMSAVRFLDLARWAREQRPDLYEQYRQSSHRGLASVLSPA